MVPRFFFKHKTAFDMRISDLSSVVCSSDLVRSCVRFGIALRPPALRLRDIGQPARLLRVCPECVDDRADIGDAERHQPWRTRAIYFIFEHPALKAAPAAPALLFWPVRHQHPCFAQYPLPADMIILVEMLVQHHLAAYILRQPVATKGAYFVTQRLQRGIACTFKV